MLHAGIDFVIRIFNAVFVYQLDCGQRGSNTAVAATSTFDVWVAIIFRVTNNILGDKVSFGIVCGTRCGCRTKQELMRREARALIGLVKVVLPTIRLRQNEI